MRVAIAGAGAVGCSVAMHLLSKGHEVVLIDKDPHSGSSVDVVGAQRILADACELAVLEKVELSRCQVVVAATGDDKVNLVVSLLARREFGVPRIVARVNDPENEWLFEKTWGVDVAVSTPRMLVALVEEAVSTGRIVRLFSFRQGNANLVEITVPHTSPLAGRSVGEVTWPPDVALVAILRDGRVITPSPLISIDRGDELLFVSSASSDHRIEAMISPLAAPSEN